MVETLRMSRLQFKPLHWLVIAILVLGTIALNVKLYTVTVESQRHSIETQALNSYQNPPWKDLQSYRGKIKTNGETGKNRRYYQKDHTHGDVEVFDRNGQHLGSMDAETGEMTKPPEEGREVGVR